MKAISPRTGNFVVEGVFGTYCDASRAELYASPKLKEAMLVIMA